MRLLADENFPRKAVEILRHEGHDVVWIRTELPGSSDEHVLRFAQMEGRLILTFDKDFGELAFRFGLPAECGIILFRVVPSSPDRIATIAAAALKSVTDFRGHFAVVEENRIRLTPLPRIDRDGPPAGS